MGALVAKFSVDGQSGGDFATAAAAAVSQMSDASQQRVARVHTGAMQDLVKKDTGRLREDILGGGFANGVKLSRTWQGKSYPRGKVSMEPAGYILTKAATIIDAFENGLTITVRNAQYLAIPEGPAKAIVRRMNQAINRSRDANGQFADEAGTVARVAAALGVEKLDVRIDRATGRGVLVAAGKALTRAGRGSTAKAARPDTVLFVLVKAATLKQRIRGRALLAELQSSAEDDFAAAVLARTALDPDA